MNGDVVFDSAVLARLESNIVRGDNVICASTPQSSARKRSNTPSMPAVTSMN